MIMRRYISHLFTWVISFLTLLAFSSCLNEHPKDQLDGGGSNASASEIFDTTIAPLYDFMGGTIDGEGIRDIQRLDSLLSLSPDDEQLYSSWQYLYRAIGMCNKSLDMIDLQSVRLTDNQKAQFKAEVRAIRAMMYYEAMDLYGRIPVLLSSAESLIYEPASGSSVTDEKLSAQSERSEIFHFIFSELQQVLPYLPQTSSLEEGSHYGRITQPVVNFLLAKLALNAEIYMYNDWAQGYRKRPKGRDLEFMVRTADGASLITGGKASENRSKILNAWETCIFYCNRLADEGCSLEEDEIFNSSARYQMPEDALLMDEADSVQHPRPAKPLFRFRYTDVLLMKAEAMERNDGDGRAEYNMVRAHAGLPARKSSLANILEDRQVVLAGETCHRQDLIRFGKFLKSSHLRRSVQSALSSCSIVFPIPQRSLAFNGKLVQNKGYEAME